MRLHLLSTLINDGELADVLFDLVFLAAFFLIRQRLLMFVYGNFLSQGKHLCIGDWLMIFELMPGNL